MFLQDENKLDFPAKKKDITLTLNVSSKMNQLLCHINKVKSLFLNNSIRAKLTILPA